MVGWLHSWPSNHLPLCLVCVQLMSIPELSSALQSDVIRPFSVCLFFCLPPFREILEGLLVLVMCSRPLHIILLTVILRSSSGPVSLILQLFLIIENRSFPWVKQSHIYICLQSTLHSCIKNTNVRYLKMSNSVPMLMNCHSNVRTSSLRHQLFLRLSVARMWKAACIKQEFKLLSVFNFVCFCLSYLLMIDRQLDNRSLRQLENLRTVFPHC